MGKGYTRYWYLISGSGRVNLRALPSTSIQALITAVGVGLVGFWSEGRLQAPSTKPQNIEIFTIKVHRVVGSWSKITSVGVHTRMKVENCKKKTHPLIMGEIQ